MLGDQLFNEFSRHIREAEVASLETICQLRMIEAEQMKQRCVEIMDMDFIGGRVKTELVGLTEGDPGFHTTAGQPHRETVRMVIAPIISSLDHGRSAKFTTPNDQGVL